MRAARMVFAVFLAIISSLSSGPARADVQVNTYTTSSQYSPSVGVSPNGDFVVVWASFGSGGSDSDGFSIQGQRYASDGSTAGAQFQVNTYITSNQRSPSVDVDMDGDFVIVWTSTGSGGTDSSNDSIQGQRYASDGSTAGAQFQVNTYITDEQTSPSVSVDSDGDFVVAWRSAESGGTDSSFDSVQGQRYASDGSATGAQFQVNAYTTNVQTSPRVGTDSDGDFVVVWVSSGSGGTDSDAYSIQGQRYASDGSTTGAQFQVNTYSTSLQFKPSVGLDSGGDFVVAWNSSGSGGTDSSRPSIQGQRYASDGSAVGIEFQVNTYTTSFQDNPVVSVDSDGDFVVVWTSDGSGGTDTSSYSIQKSDPGLVPVELQSFTVE